MSKYLVKRVLLAILSILIVSAITFFVMNLIPGGPFNKEKATSKEAQQVLEERYNLDKPIPEQYVLYMNNLLHGDWGVALHSGRNIGTEISRKFFCCIADKDLALLQLGVSSTPGQGTSTCCRCS